LKKIWEKITPKTPKIQKFKKSYKEASNQKKYRKQAINRLEKY